MLGQRRKQWANIKSTLGQGFMFAEYSYVVDKRQPQ